MHNYSFMTVSLSCTIGETGRVDSIPVAMLSDDGTFHFSNNMSLSDIWPGM